MYEEIKKSWTHQNVSISVGNMKILKISRSNQKGGRPRMLIITFLNTNIMLRLQDKNQQLQECLYLLACLKDFDDNNGQGDMSQFKNVNISKDM